MVEIPDSLVERLKARQVVLVAGLGCSELAGAPGWKAFTASLADRVVFADAREQVAALVEAGRLGDALALVRDLQPPATIEEAVRQAFPADAPLPDSLKLAAEFPWRAVVTTAFDDLWERALFPEGDRRDRRRVLVGTDVSARARIGGTDVPLLHLCGRSVVPGSLCIGAADARQRLVPSAGLAWLDQLRRKRSLIFVGFRPTDPDLVWITSWLAAQPTFGGGAGGGGGGGSTRSGRHFLFLDLSDAEDPDAEAVVWGLRTGLEILPCLEGTAEALARLAKLSASIRPQLPRADAEIDLAVWLDRWVLNPADPEPRQMLARAEAALRDDERWDGLVELLLRRLDLQDDRRHQISALGEVARIFRERLEAPERALTAEIAMLRLLPTDDDLWESLRTDARAAGAWEELVTEAAHVAEAAPATSGAARIWSEIARIEREELDRPDEALAALGQALLAAPGRRDTREAQLDLLRHTGRWRDLASVLHEAASETEDPAHAIALMLERAEVLDGSVDDAAAAIGAYEAVLALAPDSLAAIITLERLYRKAKRWADLVTLLERRAALLPAAEAAPLRLRRAEVLAEHMDALGSAADELEALAAEGDHATLSRLVEIYARAERHEDYLRTLQRLADAAGSRSEKLTLLRRLAAEGEARPDGSDRAAAALEEILLQEPRDAEAFAALVRIDRAGGRFAALAEALSRRIEVTETAEAKRELLFELAQIYERELRDPERALEALTAAEASGDRREEVHEATARLAERLERWALCAESLTKWAEVMPEGEVRAELLVEAARVFADRLGDSVAAEASLTRAFQLAPDHPQALAILARVRRDGGDHRKAVELYQKSAAHETNLEDKARLLAEAGAETLDHLRDEDRAVELFTQALAVDSENVVAGERLVDIYVRRRQWPEVETLLDVAVRRAGSDDAARSADLQTRLGVACLELGKTDKALTCLQTAHRLQPELLPLLRTYADFRFGRSEWREAAELYESLLRLHRAALPASETLDVLLRLGRCQTELENLDAAIGAYREAKALDPKHHAAAEALSTLQAERGDWSAWVAEREELAALAGPEAGTLWEAIGDACAQRLGDPGRAEEAYGKAVKAEPTRRSAIEKLLEMYLKAARFEPAVEMLRARARAETDPVVRAATYQQAARLLLGELNRPLEAAQLLECCLEDAPGMTDALEELVSLREKAGDWSGLAQSYRTMLDRLPPEAPRDLRLALWNKLGDLALRRLHDRPLAMTAFEAAAALAPDDVPRLEMLAHVYDLVGPDARDKAIAAHQRLIANDPHRTDSYLALGKLFGETGDVDKQWCVAATLWYLKTSNPALDELFRRLRPPQIRPVRQAFTEETWRRVLHPEEDRRLDQIFALAASYLVVPAAQNPATIGLKRRAQIDVAHDDSLPVRSVVALCQMLSLPLPDLFRIDGETGQTTLLDVQTKSGPRPVLLLGPPTLRRNSFDLIFDLTTHLSLLRPERFSKVALQTLPGLQLALHVLRSLGAPAGGPPDSSEAGQLKSYLQRTMPPAVSSQLLDAVRKLGDDRATEADLAKWSAATDLTGARAALVLTGELAAAFRVISSETVPLSPIPARRRMADLVAFSVSDDYFACRRQLGLAIGTP